MRLPNEPKGWRKLQRMAQRENDPQKLASIIDRMNRLLDSHEKMDANRNSDESATWNKALMGLLSSGYKPGSMKPKWRLGFDIFVRKIRG